MSLLAELRVRCHAHGLDAALIDGGGAGPPELALRAKRLTSASFRAGLAASLESAVRLPCAGSYRSQVVRTSVIHPPAAIALLAGPAVRRLAGRLRAAEGADPRGVALAVRLVTDGASPLYVGPSIDAVLDAVAEIEAAL